MISARKVNFKSDLNIDPDSNSNPLPILSISETGYYLAKYSPFAADIKNIEAIKYNYYPNPANSIVTIAFKDSKTGLIEITDVNGRVVLQKHIQNEQNFNFDISALPNGVYAVSLNNNYLNKIVVCR